MGLHSECRMKLQWSGLSQESEGPVGRSGRARRVDDGDSTVASLS